MSQSVGPKTRTVSVLGQNDNKHFYFTKDGWIDVNKTRPKGESKMASAEERPKVSTIGDYPGQENLSEFSLYDDHDCKTNWKQFIIAVNAAIEQSKSCQKTVDMKNRETKRWINYISKRVYTQIKARDDESEHLIPMRESNIMSEREDILPSRKYETEWITDIKPVSSGIRIEESCIMSTDMKDSFISNDLLKVDIICADADTVTTAAGEEGFEELEEDLEEESLNMEYEEEQERKESEDEEEIVLYGEELEETEEIREISQFPEKSTSMSEHGSSISPEESAVEEVFEELIETEQQLSDSDAEISETSKKFTCVQYSSDIVTFDSSSKEDSLRIDSPETRMVKDNSEVYTEKKEIKNRKKQYFEDLKSKYAFFVTNPVDGKTVMIPRSDIKTDLIKKAMKTYYAECKHRMESRGHDKSHSEKISLGSEPDSTESSIDYKSNEEPPVEKRRLTPFEQCMRDMKRADREKVIETSTTSPNLQKSDDTYYDYEGNLDFNAFLQGEDDFYPIDYSKIDDLIVSNEMSKRDTETISGRQQESCSDVVISMSDINREVDFDDVHSKYRLESLAEVRKSSHEYKKELYLKIMNNLIDREIQIDGDKLKIRDLLGEEMVEKLLDCKIERISMYKQRQNEGGDVNEYIAKDIVNDSNCDSEMGLAESFVQSRVIEKSGIEKDPRLMERLLDQMTDEILREPNKNESDKINTQHLIEVILQVKRMSSLNLDNPKRHLIHFKHEDVTFKEGHDSPITERRSIKKELVISDVEHDDTPQKMPQDNSQSGPQSKEYLFHPFQKNTLKYPIKLPSGASYFGNWNNDSINSCGIYKTPEGIVIECLTKDGLFDGDARVIYPNGMVMTGIFIKNKFFMKQCIFGDGLEFKSKNWKYLNGRDRRFWSEMKGYRRPGLQKTNDPEPRRVPQGCLDTGEGFYSPNTKYIHHPKTLKPIRIPTEAEVDEILLGCRKGWEECVSQSRHLYEHNMKRKFHYKCSPSSSATNILEKIPTGDRIEIQKSSIEKWISLDHSKPSGQEILESITNLFKPKTNISNSNSSIQHVTGLDQMPNVKSIKMQHRYQSQANMNRLQGICYNLLAKCHDKF